MKLVASFSKKEAREILAEIVKPRARRKKGEILSPGEETLLDIICGLEKKDHEYYRPHHEGLICLAMSLEIYPIPDWFRVKRRLFPVDEYSLRGKVSVFTAEKLLEVTREFKRTKR